MADKESTNGDVHTPRWQRSITASPTQHPTQPIPLQMPLTAEDRRRLFSTYQGEGLLTATTPLAPFNFDTDTAESIASGHTKITDPAEYDPFLSPFEPNHKLEIQYPYLNLLAEDGSEECILHLPVNAKERYQPLPLVADEKIWANAGREKAPECQFYTLHRAEPAVEGVSRKGIDCGDLNADVRDVIKYVGKSKMYVVIYKNPAKAGPQVRIRRETYFRLKNDYRENERQEYNVSLDELLKKKHDARWYLDLVDLIEMRTERAARHVQMILYAWSKDHERGIKLGAPALWERFRKAWRKPIVPTYAPYLNEVASEIKRTSTRLLMGRQQCKKCEKPFTNPHHAALGMLCCQKLIGRSCLDDHLSYGFLPPPIPPFPKPTCPFCKAPLFRSGTWQRQLICAVNPDGTQYLPSPLYTPWENFERSCCDLDIQYPSQSNHPITIHPSLLKKIWTHILSNSIRPTEEPHYQLPRTYEFTLYQQTLFQHIVLLSSLTTTLSHLHSFLTNHIYLEFRRQFYSAGLSYYLPPGMQRRSWVGDEEIKRRVFVRDGFEEFTNRLLGRTLMFLVVRKCNCDVLEGRKTLWHKHKGDNVRCWWNGREEVSAEVKSWQEKTSEGKSYVRDFHAFGTG